MIPDGMEMKALVCEGPVMPDTVSSVPPYLDPAQVGHILNMAKDMTDMAVPDWQVFGSLVIVTLAVAVVVWLIDNAGPALTRLKRRWRR